MNKGLKNASINDEIYTPEYAVLPILKYISKGSKIILPFDTEDSAFYRVLQRNGYDVTARHIDDGQDFFFDFYDEYDMIISNPPFSIKDRVLERLYLIGKPFMVLLPLTALSSQKRVDMFIKRGVEVLVFDRRIGFEMDGELRNSNWFASAYFCWNVLPETLVFEKLDKEMIE